MRTRFTAISLTLLAFLLLISTQVQAAPEAHIVRIDPRASFTDGAPVLTVVVDLVQSKPISEAINACGDMRGNAQIDCQAEALEQPKALYKVINLPEKNANFLVTVDGAARPTKFISKARWGDSIKQPDVGTAWLIVVDASGSMANRLGDAKQIADAFINSMGPNDIVNVVGISDTQVTRFSNWLSAAQRGNATSFVDGIPLYPSAGRNRPLFNFIKTAVNDGFRSLGNVGSTVKVPLHQALIVLSSGSAGTDPLSTGPGAEQLKQHLSEGRFPDANSALPKAPVPVISIWFPVTQLAEELHENAQQFMQNLANIELGGFYTVVRQGQGGHAARIVASVHDRFNQMNILKYRVSCIAPNVIQTFQLVFNNVNPMIAGDSSFKEVPVGVDPTTWPLDINAQYTMDQAKRNPVYPAGSFRVWGDFCWGGDKNRAEVYFLPKNQPAPPSVEGGDVESAKRAQQQLIAMKMNGKSVQATDTYVEFEAPDSDKILLGSGDKAIVRLVIFDNKAGRTSPVDAKNILTLKAETAPFPILWIGLGGFAFIIVVLLVLLLIRGGGRKRSGGAPPPAPIVAGGGPGVAQGYGPPGGPAQPYGAPQGQPPQQPPGYGAGPPQQPPGYGAAPPQQPPGYGAPAPMQAGFGAGAPAAPAPAGDFMYGGQPPQFGLTGGQPAVQQPPPDPYGANPAQMGGAMPGAMGAAAGAMAGGMPGAAAGASRAVISGSAGTFPIQPGIEVNVGRDGSRCQVLLQEPRVSGVHATLRFEASQLLVRDDGSNNGTFLNGNRLGAGAFTPVPAGSIVRFGPVEFLVRLE